MQGGWLSTGQPSFPAYGCSCPIETNLRVCFFTYSRASEGKTVEVPYKGPVEVTIRDVLGGVRSTCTYVGAGKLKELSRRTTFIRVTQQLNTVYGNDG